MDYKRKYKEAVNKIRNLLDDGEKNGFTIVTYKTDLESIFPELKELEDERIRKEIITFIATTPKQRNSHSKWLAWLEKQGEQKPAWSEEEEVKINRIVACLENLNVADNDILLKDVDWLKSLRPQNTWKPSDEQMTALRKASKNEYLTAEQYDILVSLYDDLKKLREE